MKLKYFKECKTAEECKKAYKTFAKKLHPDNGGDVTKFQAMQQEFSAVWEKLKNIHINSEGETYTKETNETAGEFMDIIEKLIQMSGCNVEVCGSWIWVSGNTKFYKEQLKELGFRFSRSKSAWYLGQTAAYHKKYRSKYTMDDIRGMYGSTEYETKPYSALA